MGQHLVERMSKPISILGQTFILHPLGVMFWEEEKALVISDVHLGKISHFRKHGSAIPQQAVLANFQKMNEVIELFEPSKILFLGDLFHSTLNKEWILFEAWLETISAEVILIEGNHDIISPLRYEQLGVQTTPELIIGQFLLTHHPEKRSGFFNFSGHIHPGVAINGKGRQRIKISCFFKTSDQMIFPAFGEFTGNYILTPKPGDEVFVIAGNEVIQIS